MSRRFVVGFSKIGTYRSKSDDVMTDTAKPRVVRSTGLPPEALTPCEWRVLRACFRLGPEARVAEIVGELHKDALVDYRYVQTLLARLVSKGYLEVEKRSPRISLYTAVHPAKDLLSQQVRIFLDYVIGLEPENIRLMREVLDDLESQGPYLAFDEASLPRDLRVRLLPLIDSFIRRKRNRWAVAGALGLSPADLDRFPALNRSVYLLKTAGGDTISAAVKVLDVIDELLEPEDEEMAQELAATREELQALTAS